MDGSAAAAAARTTTPPSTTATVCVRPAAMAVTPAAELPCGTFHSCASSSRPRPRSARRAPRFTCRAARGRAHDIFGIYERTSQDMSSATACFVLLLLCFAGRSGDRGCAAAKRAPHFSPAHCHHRVVRDDVLRRQPQLPIVVDTPPPQSCAKRNATTFEPTSQTVNRSPSIV